jgi:TRAP-type C4-dicarboxylate transport system permease small subunit
MADGTTRDRRRIWLVVLGAAVGVALGILVGVTTDVPFAPEAGLLLGGLVGWFSAAGLRR